MPCAEKIVQIERVIVMPTSALLKDVEHWLRRSATMRELAEIADDPDARLAMLKVAAEYAYIAYRAMERNAEGDHPDGQQDGKSATSTPDTPAN